MGKKDSYMVCSSEAFKSGKEAEEAVHPPHIQARRTYEAYLTAVEGRQFIVTGENGDTNRPAPVVVQIQKSGLSVKAVSETASVAVMTAASTPRNHYSSG